MFFQDFDSPRRQSMKFAGEANLPRVCAVLDLAVRKHDGGK